MLSERFLFLETLIGNLEERKNEEKSSRFSDDDMMRIEGNFLGIHWISFFLKRVMF
jgi:hypothetical protein